MLCNNALKNSGCSKEKLIKPEKENNSKVQEIPETNATIQSISFEFIIHTIHKQVDRSENVSSRTTARYSQGYFM